jgi:hypothetical protein
MPFYPEVLRVKEHALTPPSVVFTIGFVVESIKELGGVSNYAIDMVCFAKSSHSMSGKIQLCCL